MTLLGSVVVLLMRGRMYRRFRDGATAGGRGGRCCCGRSGAGIVGEIIGHGRRMMCAVGSTIAVLLTLAVGLGAASRPVPEPAERPVPRAHAHNDYQHAHPLFDALHHGFVGVEADVYLVGKALRISHDKVKDWTTVPTLEAAYLTPLSELKTKRKSGGIYPDGTRLLFMIDIKSPAAPTYERVHEVLGKYEAANPGLFTVYTKSAGGK